MDEQNVNLLFVVDKIIEKLDGRAGVIDLDLDDELVNEIRLEMAETIRENYAAAALSQPAATEVWCGCGDGYPENSFDAGFMAKAGHCQNCEATHPAAQGDSSHPAGGECGGVQLQLGPMALEFNSHQQWVNSARNWFINLAATNRNAAQKRYVAVDASGRVCMIGADFARARDENTFPVRVYLIDAAPKAAP